MTKELQEFILELEKKYCDTQDEYVDYVLSRSDVCGDQNIKTKQEAREYLDNIDTEGGYDNTIWESGHLAGMRDIIIALKHMND